MERHQAAEPQWPAGARSVGRRHQDRPHRNRGLLPGELRQAQRHAAHLRGARHAVVQGARRRQRRAAQLRLHVLRNREGARRPATWCSSPRCTRARKIASRWCRRATSSSPSARGSAAQLKTTATVKEPVIAPDQGRPGAGRTHGQRRQGRDRARAAGRPGGGARRRLVDAHGGRHLALDGIGFDRWASRCRSVS